MMLRQALHTPFSSICSLRHQAPCPDGLTGVAKAVYALSAFLVDDAYARGFALLVISGDNHHTISKIDYNYTYCFTKTESWLNSYHAQ